MYIDDSVLASAIHVDKVCVPLLPTLGPLGVFESCGLGIPGTWLSAEHRLRDVRDNVEAMGMKINAKKTTVMFFNFTKKMQCLPFCSLDVGDPLPIVSESRLLGIIMDDKLTWWPLVRDIQTHAKAKIWSLVKCREAGATRSQLLSLHIARVRSTIEYAVQVYGTVINLSQADEIESVQRRCLQIVLGSESKSYERNLTTLSLSSLADRRQFLVK